MGSITDSVADDYEERREKAEQDAWAKHYEKHRKQSSVKQFVNVVKEMQPITRIISDASLTEFERRKLNSFVRLVEAYMFPHED